MAGAQLHPPTAGDIDAARLRLRGHVERTPLVRLHVANGSEIRLKLENLQPLGSFKLRSALAAITARPREAFARGVWTASAGNFGQGLALAARRLDLPMAAVVPDIAAASKLKAMERLGAKVEVVGFQTWWRVLEERRHAGLTGEFIHPFADNAVMAGNATIGAEILEEWPEVDLILAPFGGGGLISGIAAARRAACSPALVVAAESEAAPQLRAALEAGRPVEIERVPSFIDGMGGGGVFPEMWPLVGTEVDGSVVVSVEEIALAVIKLLRDNKIVAEGAGAATVAAALSAKRPPANRIACIVSGGNIDTGVLARFLGNEDSD